jgi:hypothetical protein
MKKLSIASIAASLLASSACYAQLGEAPMPQVKTPEVSGPSLEETTQWIIDKLKKENMIPKIKPKGKNDYYYDDISFNGCDMTVIERQDEYQDDTLSHKWVENLHLIPLVEVDEDTIRASSFQSSSPPIGYVSFNSIGKRPVFHQAYGAVIGNGFASEAQMLGYLKTIGTTSQNGYQIVFGREEASLKTAELELAERTANAFKHAVKLCKAKARQEREKAAQEKAEKAKSQPKEIF